MTNANSAASFLALQCLQQHRLEGGGYWGGESCHKRRTYYRHRERYNRSRRLKYKGEKESATQLAGTQLTEDLESIKQQGFVVDSMYGNLEIGDINLADLEQIAALNNVVIY